MHVVYEDTGLKEYAKQGIASSSIRGMWELGWGSRKKKRAIPSCPIFSETSVNLFWDVKI